MLSLYFFTSPSSHIHEHASQKSTGWVAAGWVASFFPSLVFLRQGTDPLLPKPPLPALSLQERHSPKSPLGGWVGRWVGSNFFSSLAFLKALSIRSSPKTSSPSPLPTRKTLSQKLTGWVAARWVATVLHYRSTRSRVSVYVV